MGLFGFDVGSRASDESCVLKNLDCRSVSKNHDSGTKPGGDMKPRAGRIEKKSKCLVRFSRLSAENREKSESKYPL
jgi:hypothetical protein